MNDNQGDPEFSMLLRTASEFSNASSSTTNSLNIQFSENSILHPNQLLAIIKQNENQENYESIISEINGKEFQMPLPGNLIAQDDENKSRIAYAWWNLYGYGLRVDNAIYCTFDQKNEDIDVNSICIKEISAKTSQTSTFIRHLEKNHDFTQEKRK